MKPSFRFLSSLLLLSLLTLNATAQRKKKKDRVADKAEWLKPADYASLNYRYIGPDGNRIIAVTGEPGNPLVVYAGAASGGVFKTEDGGVSWQPVFDDQEVSSIGALAIAPSDNNVVWAGTGETFIRSNISIGNGIYKSTDAGETWQHMGLGNTGRIGRIIIDPRDKNVVYAAALGHSYGPQEERGVYKTTNGGETWERVLFVDENTGASDIALDVNNPDVLIAGMWQLEIKTWVRNSGGPGSGLYISKDAGESWNRLEGAGLPKFPWGKVAVGIAPGNSDRIYALIETAQYEFDGVLFRSDDGGSSWDRISHDQEYTQRPHYYSRLAISPEDDEEVYFMAHGVWKTTDGGADASRLPGVGGDDHDMWIDPENPDRLIVGNDGGVAISLNRGQSWLRPQLPTGQMYHVAVDNQIPYNVYGNRQDGPSTMGPSNSRMGGGINIGLWHPVGGGESGFTYPDPVDPDIIWSASYDASLTRYDRKTGHAREVRVWPDEPMGWGPAELKYRFNWTFPIHISPHDHNKVYVGSQFVHVTTNGGQSWQEISPDLTTNDKSKQVTSGGLTIDNIGVEFGSTLFAIAESPVEAGVIWTGSNDGLVHVSRDAGNSWTNVTTNIPNLPTWGTISNIEPSRFKAGKAYISIDFHQMNNRDPYAFKTEDYGQTWQLITADIPKSHLSYVHVVREDPSREGLLYLGTENAVYFSYDDGTSWLTLQNNLPHAPVHWLTIQEDFNDLVIATYGRGFWIMDDISALQQMNAEVAQSKFYLFEQREAYRFQNISAPGRGQRTEADGRNPRYGASINYWVGELPEGTKPEITILNKSGEEIRTLKGSARFGLNRVQWDLRHERATEPKLRTLPLGMPNDKALPERLRLDEKGWRPLITWGYGGFEGPLVIPGTYTIRVKVGEETFEQPLEVKKDPNTTGSLADIDDQTVLALNIRDNISSVAEMVNKAEWMRKQVDDIQSLLKAQPNEAVSKAVQALDEQIIAVESKLFQLTLTGTFADDLRGPTMLYSKLMNLADQVQQGDFRPTDQQIAVHAMHHKNLAEYERMMDDVLSGILPKTNEVLESNGFPIVMPIVVQE
jgi:photosystem II stability/assembly factor-like uncharacterized protein